MLPEIDHERRRLFGRLGLGLAALRLGSIGAVMEQLGCTAAPPFTGRDLPALDGATGWLNSKPLTPAALRGRVVLVQFWTYTCINWLRTMPYVRAWSEKYRDKGLVVLGVHTPEFPFEHDADNVQRAVSAMRIEYPIALDSDYAIWTAFDNAYWPAHYFVDGAGHIRGTQFGEGSYDNSERLIQKLLAEARGTRVADDLVTVEGQGAEFAAQWGSLKSPENYVGYERTVGFSSPEGIGPDVRRRYTVPPRLERNHWALGGEWTLEPGLARLEAPGGKLGYAFHARDLHFVMGPAKPGERVRFRVRLDGQQLGAAQGGDVDGQGNGVLVEPRLYQLVRQPGRIEDRRFEIEFLEGGAQAYSFTFG